MNSAQGGMVTADNRQPEGKEARSWEECQRIGRMLADEALRIVHAAPEQDSPKLFCAARTLTLPVDAPLMRELLKAACAQVNKDLGKLSAEKADAIIAAAGEIGERDHATEFDQPRQRPDSHNPGGSLAQHRLLFEAQDAGRAQPALWPYQ